MLSEALRLYDAGYMPIPVKLDGSKRPPFPWKMYTQFRPGRHIVQGWWTYEPRGLAIIGGKVSGGFECLDFDDHAGLGTIRPVDLMEQVPVNIHRKVSYYRTPGAGFRVAWRSAECPEYRKVVLARDSEKRTTCELLSTQVILVPGGDPRSHASGKPYLYWPSAIPRYGRTLYDLTQSLTAEEREWVVAWGASENKYIREERVLPERVERPDRDDDGVEPRGEPDTAAPWADFDQRGDWHQILEPVGWTVDHHAGDVTFWTRPDKSSGVSASTEHVPGKLYVFSANCLPLEPERAYSKSAVWALTRHGGNFSASNADLRGRGYGAKQSRQKDKSVTTEDWLRFRQKIEDYIL